MTIKNNPLLEAFDEAPFSKIQIQHYKPAIEECIKQAKTEIESITSNPDAPTFANTIEALEFSGIQLERVTSVFFNLNSAETTDEMQKIAQEVSPLLSEFGNDITLNVDLFKRIKSVYDTKEQLHLNEEQHTLLVKKYKGFTRNGANLNDEDKQRLRELDKELSTLALKFGENVLAETNNFELHITDKKDLAGLPESIIESAEELAIAKERDGYIFTLEYPSYVPFMKYAQNRQLRKKMAMAFGSRCFKGNKYDNQEIVLKIANLRHQRAQLLGYETHAHFVLEERMAKNPETVNTFLKDFLIKTKPIALRQFQDLKDFAKEKDGINLLQKWDGAYYTEKLKKQQIQLDDEELKNYFKLENVIAGVFQVAEKLFKLTFEEVFNVNKYHQDVKTYRIYENGNFKALFYADFHPRKGKRPGAWMTVYKNQYKRNGDNIRPHISIVCNFSKPTKNKPSLLTFNEVTTLFHEFGHALHGILADTKYPSLSGTAVYWDFVELPSQLLENWCYEKEALELFATHYKTGELIPQAYISKIKQLNQFQQGVQTMRQLSFGLLDMAWHSTDPSTITDVYGYESKSFAETKLYPEVKNNSMSCSFSHIFQGGYSSGYYSYKWAEVLDADAFHYFKEQGIFNSEVSENLKNSILSKGGVEDPTNLYMKFRGRKPDQIALLKRSGLYKS